MTEVWCFAWSEGKSIKMSEKTPIQNTTRSSVSQASLTFPHSLTICKMPFCCMSWLLLRILYILICIFFLSGTCVISDKASKHTWFLFVLWRRTIFSLCEWRGMQLLLFFHTRTWSYRDKILVYHGETSTFVVCQHSCFCGANIITVW